MNPMLKKTSLLLLTLGLAGCSTFSTFTTESRFRFPERQIIIDGKTDDWRGDMFFVENELISLGFLNDQENLYVCLLAENNLTRAQIMRQGLTVWFDPHGGNNKVFGVKFPLGLPPREGTNSSKGDLEEVEEKTAPEGPLTELEIIRSEKETPQRLMIANVKGIEIKAVPSAGLLVYELKIPLIQREEHPYAVGAEPGKTIGIGFETGKFDSSQMRRKGSGETPGGGRPPMGGSRGRGGMGGGMGGLGRGSQRPESLKIWATVKLAQGQGNLEPELLFLSH